MKISEYAESFHNEWTKKYAKIRGVFVKQEPLFCQLLPDMTKYSAHLTPMRIFQSDEKQKSIHDLNTQTASFMWFQLLIRIILTMENNRDDRAKKDLIDVCRKRYEGNITEQQRITEFENNYRSGQAIHWYTRDSFLYRSVNRAFRTADIDIIYQFRFIIAEIHEQLASLSRPSTANLVVYRGQLISTEEMRIIEANQEKGFISMNTFLSTTENCDQAVGFSGIGTGVPEGLKCVLYKITIGETRQPFARIDGLSAIPTENEILFSIGTVFRIDSVEEWPSGWEVSLNLTTEVEERFEMLMKHFLDEIGQKPTLAMLGKFLMMQGDYNRAKRYFEFLLDMNGSDTDDEGRVICYEYLANISDEKGEYEKAMYYHHQILNIQQRRLNPDDPYFTQIYNNIAATQMALGQYDEAAKNFELSISYDVQNQSYDKRGLSISYNNVATMYTELGDYTNAAHYYEKALENQLELGLGALKHPDIAIIYHNLATLYDDMKQPERAIQYYEEALTIQKVSLPPEHPARIVTESGLAMAYLQMNNNTLALQTCLAVLDSKLKIHPPNFPSLSKTYMNLGYIYQDSGDFNKAEEQYKIALQINERHLPANHPQTGKNHQLIGDLYDEMGKTKEALNHYQQARYIFQIQDTPSFTELGKAYVNLGTIETVSSKAIDYLEQGLSTLLRVDVIDKRVLAFAYDALGTKHRECDNLEEALKNHKKALDLGLELVNYDENHPSLSNYYHGLGATFADQGNIEKGLEYVQKALNNMLKIRDPDHPILGPIYNTLGDCYNELKKHDQAIEYYQKAINAYKQPNAQNLRSLAMAYVSMGSTHYDINDQEKAIEYYRMALDLQLKNLEPDDPDLIVTYWYLASYYEDREDYTAALTYLIPKLTIQEKVLSSFDLELADAYHDVGTIYFFNKQYQCAVELYEKSLNIRRQQKSRLASAYDALGDAYKSLYEFDAALNNYEMAIKHLIEEGEKEKSDDYYEVLCTLYKSVGTMQQRLNLLDEAQKSLQQSLALCDTYLINNEEHDELRCNILKSLAQIDKTTQKITSRSLVCSIY
ncbi:unnamed protein product [Rotaria sp. Silwood1]|nr:unnamed protein product [Rotaria sp. Silwood1]